MNKTTEPSVDEDRPAHSKSARNAGRLFSRWWFWLLVLGIAAGSYFLFLRPESPAEAPGGGKFQARGGGRPTSVTGVPAKSTDVDVSLTGLGAVTPMNVVTVKPRVDGQLMRVLFREGQSVKAGEVLAEIDPRPFQVQLTQAQGQLARDQALLKNAQLDLERYRTLLEQDSIAKQQLDTQAALVRQYEGTVKADQGQIENAKLQLTYSRITAPISGRLGLRQIDPGNIVHSSDQNGLVVITQLQPVTVVFTIPEDSVPDVMKKIQAGEKLSVDAYDREGKKKLAAGYLLTVDNQIDPATGTVKLKAQFPNDDFGLFPNQFVNVRLLVDIRRAATVIPVAAIQRGRQGVFVYVVKPDNSVTVRPVVLGPTQGEMTVVESGLALGEVVVTDGADKLREGAKVEVAAKDVGAPREGGPRKQGEGRRHQGGRGAGGEK